MYFKLWNMETGFCLVLSCWSHINPSFQLSPGFQFAAMIGSKPGFYFSVVTMSSVSQKCKDRQGKGPKGQEPFFFLGFLFLGASRGEGW